MLSTKPRSDTHKEQRSWAWRLHLDLPLLLGLLVLMAIAQVVLYSASGQDIVMVEKQVVRLALALALMFGLAQVPPRVLKFWTVPLYVAGLLLLTVFYQKLAGTPFQLPYGGMRSEENSLFAHMILPVTCATYSSLAYFARFVKSNMEEVIRQDYIRTARAKGAGPMRVLIVHAFRNTMIPFVTMIDVPVSAARKLAPVMPTSAARKRSRSTARASVRSCTGS